MGVNSQDLTVLTKNHNQQSSFIFFRVHNAHGCRVDPFYSDITLENKDDKVYFRAKDSNNTFSNSSSDYYRFVINGKMRCEGNIMLLLDSTGVSKEVPTNAFCRLFEGCESLTTAPVLPAATLEGGCYREMFYGCKKLNSVTVKFTSLTGSYVTTNWLYDVAETRTFTCPSGLQAAGTISNGNISKIPNGWTVVNPK